jgi:DNA polymerase-3 subunit beta
MAAVNRVSLIARSSEYNIVKLDFSMGQVHISSNSPEIGHAEETVPVVIDGPDVQIAFNGTYITDVLKHVDTKEFYLSLNESLNPAAVRETEDEAFIYIVTPVRVSR